MNHFCVQKKKYCFVWRTRRVIHTYIMFAFETVVPGYAAELSDTDTSGTSSDSDDESEDTSETSHSLVNESTVANKRPRLDNPQENDRPSPIISHTNESSSSDDDDDESSSSDDDDDESSSSDDDDESSSSDDDDDESASSKQISEEQWLRELAEHYAKKLHKQMETNPLINSMRSLKNSITKLDYEIQSGKPWKQGTGRAKSFYTYMCTYLNVTTNTRFNMTRKKMHCVFQQTQSILEKQYT